MLRPLLRTCVHHAGSLDQVIMQVDASWRSCAAFFQSIESSTRSDEYFHFAVHVCANAARRSDGPRISWRGAHSGVGPLCVPAYLASAATALVYVGGGLHG